MNVKICGLKTPSDIDNCIKAGADFIGFVFFQKSPRHLSPANAAELSDYYDRNYSDSGIKKVALCVNPTDTELSEIISTSKPDFLQLHGIEPPMRVDEIRQKYGLPIIKAIRVKTQLDIKASQQYNFSADWLLFDAAASADLMPGGNGESFNWSLLADFECDLPWMLAGGLNPNNVAHAIAQTNPDGVDVSSGVEASAGIKDDLLISAFVKAAKTSS
jgi:phosphoribosylanthranilate isomerase